MGGALGSGGGFATGGGGSAGSAGGTPNGGGGATAVSMAGAAGALLAGSGGADAGASGNAGSGGSAGAAGGQAGAAGAGPAPSEGQVLYDAACNVCHGAQGVGTVAAPELQHPVRDYATWVVRNGRAQTTFPMPMAKFAKGTLTDAQLTLIFDYLSLPPKPTAAQALFTDYCANCHGPNGEGGPSKRPLAGEVSNVNDRVRNGSNVGQYSMRHDSMPAFSTSLISDAELKLLHDYVGAL